MNPTICNYAQFFDYCIYGNLKEAQKMISDNYFSPTDIDEGIFSYTCYFGQISVLKWIYSLNPQKYSNICALNKDLIKIVSISGYPEVVEWMLSILK